VKVIGITGKIASGKNLLSSLINYNFKCKIFDADKIVHELYAKDYKVINEIKNIAPESFLDEKIDRKILLLKIFNEYSILDKIEKIVHPVVLEKLCSFLKTCRRNQIELVILNIPLLFEISADVFCEKILILDVSKVVFKNRLKDRYGNTNKFLYKSRKTQNITSKNKFYYIKSGIERINLLRQFIQIKI
jgi:dephospho-CoA kinase